MGDVIDSADCTLIQIPIAIEPSASATRHDRIEAIARSRGQRSGNEITVESAIIPAVAPTAKTPTYAIARL